MSNLSGHLETGLHSRAKNLTEQHGTARNIELQVLRCGYYNHMRSQNPYAVYLTTSDEEAQLALKNVIQRLQTIHRISGYMVVFFLLVGGLGTIVGMRRAFARAAETTAIQPWELASHMSHAFGIGGVFLFFAGIAYCVRLWACFRLRCLSAPSNSAISSSEKLLRHRIQLLRTDSFDDD